MSEPNTGAIYRPEPVRVIDEHLLRLKVMDAFMHLSAEDREHIARADGPNVFTYRTFWFGGRVKVTMATDLLVVDVPEAEVTYPVRDGPPPAAVYTGADGSAVLALNGHEYADNDYVLMQAGVIARMVKSASMVAAWNAAAKARQEAAPTPRQRRVHGSSRTVAR